MVLKLRAVPTVVCSCFYALLETAGDVERNAGVAWETWTNTVTAEVGEEPEAARLREDLALLGREAFIAEWNYLLGVLDAGTPGELRDLLRKVFLPSLAAGYARRAGRTGQA